MRGVLEVGDVRLAHHFRELGSPLRAESVVVKTARVWGGVHRL